MWPQPRIRSRARFITQYEAAQWLQVEPHQLQRVWGFPAQFLGSGAHPAFTFYWAVQVEEFAERRAHTGAPVPPVPPHWARLPVTDGPPYDTL